MYTAYNQRFSFGDCEINWVYSGRNIIHNLNKFIVVYFVDCSDQPFQLFTWKRLEAIKIFSQYNLDNFDIFKRREKHRLKVEKKGKHTYVEIH